MALPSPTVEFVSSLRTRRIEGLSDAAFGIIMTILILEIPVPELDHPTTLDMTRALVRLWPSFLGYFVSFTMLGTFWVAQHEQFHFIKHVDHAFLWLTMLFLMLIASVPFTTTLIGRYMELPSVVALYGAHMLTISLVHYATWRHMTGNRRLVDPDIGQQNLTMHLRRSVGLSAIYMFATGLAFVSVIFSMAVYTLVPVVYSLLPSIYAKRRRLRER